MKILFIIGGLLTGVLFFTPDQKGLAGTWVLDTKEKKCDPSVLRFQMGEGYYIAKLDMPDQQVYDKTVSLEVRNDSIRIILDKKKDCFIEAVITDSTLEGRSVVDGRSEPVIFHRAG